MAGAEGVEDLLSQGEVVGGGLAAVLEEGVGGVRFGEGLLVVVGEVDVVEGEGDDGEGVRGGAEGILEG